ncbi:MAG: hypothetical protein M1832_003552 [Thelocarpon impressellum]|nr:MAG: hypothetical protein M1832_003552 [Thelocarpon impressellum]
MGPKNGALAVRPADNARPTISDLQEENEYTRFARKTWLGKTAVKPGSIKADLLKSELWDFIEGEKFHSRPLLILENLHCLESYLWPGYSDDSSHVHVLLIALMVNVKAKENLPVWECFKDRPSDFSSLFRRILSMSLDFSLSTAIRTHVLCFLICAFQSLDNGLLRKECAPLVSISIWHSLSSERARDQKLEQRVQVKKAWRAAGKRYDAADDAAKSKMRFDRSWLFSMILDFLNRLYGVPETSFDELVYCERFVEFLTDLESQLPTRRYVNALIHDLNVLPAIKLSPLFGNEDGLLLRDLTGLLRHFAYFSIDDHTGVQLSKGDSHDAHYKALARLQRNAMKYLKSKLTVLALSNYAAIDERAELDVHFSTLTDMELRELCGHLDYRLVYPKKTAVVVERDFLKEVLISAHERRKTFQEVAKELSICPTEQTLFEVGLLRNASYNGSRPLAIPKMNLQYLTVGDFLWRSFILHRCEAFFGIKLDVEDALKRLQPRIHSQTGETRFDGNCKMAVPISKPAVVEVAPPRDDAESPLMPPYVLDFSLEKQQPSITHTSKKRRRDQMEAEQNGQSIVKVSSYKPLNSGPYPTDVPRQNRIRFTPAQADAIISGTQPGLTCIVGPPGTGKTDVAVQIINNLYHNFPNERTLLLAHSNQALNQLFEKIIALDIDERHLLRLGHGEEDLATDTNYSKHGRVESFLENRERYLGEVNRLAANLGAPGAHGNSCETAGYFDSVYVAPTWKKYQEAVQDDEATAAEVVEAFPFKQYFCDAPQPLFPPESSPTEAREIATGCYRHIRRIFSELADIRPFELLRTSRDKANYLLVKEARIIAMTTTHAAMRRREIESIGFHYDNVIMEEAAQITEIETFLPLALQRPKDGELPVKRVVLCGDHLQNSPIIQNLALRQYANLEQSLFLRLIRLGVPTVTLDRQGRARASIADLYRWRYKQLGDLPIVGAAREFLTANAGFRHEYQFINVPDYKGVGEAEPTAHFIQNLGEAEFCVAIYQYMRLLGYPASKISILTTYAGQRSLIRDVLGHRCARNRLFGLPKTVTTVDQYQGEQNDYVLLSLTRTSRVGYLRDIRRLTVAFSRARLGLYVLGRRDVFESCYELKEAFDILLRRPDKLLLKVGEMHPTARAVGDEVEGTEMDGVEHLGKYVYEMTQVKLGHAQVGKNLAFTSIRFRNAKGDVVARGSHTKYVALAFKDRKNIVGELEAGADAGRVGS